MCARARVCLGLCVFVLLMLCVVDIRKMVPGLTRCRWLSSEMLSTALGSWLRFNLPPQQLLLPMPIL